LSSLKAQIGQGELQVQGHLGWTMEEGLGAVDLHVEGDGLSLIRKAGLLLRSDVDLKVSGGDGRPWMIDGAVDLRDGLLLFDSTALLVAPGGATRSAASRPPYFSVGVAPWKDFRLDIALTGDAFMRVRTPVFQGTLSMDMRMGGTLEEPLLSGRVNVADGRVVFPFAAFAVESGGVELRMDQPFDLLLDLRGSSQRQGYDLMMEVSGLASEPMLRFTSSPPLPSEDILMMVVSGESPEGMHRYSTANRMGRLGQYFAQGWFASPDGAENPWMARFSMDSGSKLSRQGKETLEMEFRMNDRMQVLGEYDEYDFWNAGIRYRMVVPGAAWRKKSKGNP
jgi:translocation and assembly module TamB